MHGIYCWHVLRACELVNSHIYTHLHEFTWIIHTFVPQYHISYFLWISEFTIGLEFTLSREFPPNLQICEFTHLHWIMQIAHLPTLSATAPPQGRWPQPQFIMSSICTGQGLKTFGWVQKVWLGVTTSAQRWQFFNGHFTPYARPPCVCRRRRRILRPMSQTKSEHWCLCSV